MTEEEIPNDEEVVVEKKKEIAPANVVSQVPGVFFKRHGKGGLDVDVDDRFDINLPKSKFLIIIIGYVILMIGQGFYMEQTEGGIAILVLFGALTIVPVLLWWRIGPAIGEKLILGWLKKTGGRAKMISPVEFFVGFPFNLKDPYFIEANPSDLNARNVPLMVNRVREVLFLSIGITFTLSKLLAPTFFPALDAKWGYVNMDEMIMDTAVYLGPLALLLLFAVMPLIWLTEDCQIYRVDQYQDVTRLGRYLRVGMLSKVLGFLGIILAFDVAKTFAAGDVCPSGDPLCVATSQPEIYLKAFTQFAWILLACSAAPFLIATVYLFYFHQAWVNHLRIKASDFLPTGTIQVNKVADTELEILTHPERLPEIEDNIDKVSKLGVFFKTLAGKITLVALSVVAGIVCFYFGFIY